MAFGRLSAARKPDRPISDINVTPLVDVMLVLVVIFILAAPMLAASLRVQLPKVQAAQPVTPAASAQSLVLEVTGQGQLWLHGQPVSETQLQQQLQSLGQHNPQAELQLKADTNVPYGRVAQLMGFAHAAGLTRIGFVALPDKK